MHACAVAHPRACEFSAVVVSCSLLVCCVGVARCAPLCRGAGGWGALWRSLRQRAARQWHRRHTHEHGGRAPRRGRHRSAPRLVWGRLARARGAASWACSSGASWCSATRLRSRIDPAGMCIDVALAARIEPPLRPARPARSAAGLQQRQQRQPPSRAAHAAADRQRRGKVPAAAQRAVVAVSLRGQE